MAGIQKYTSSLFIQSGSVAKFESGLEVTESIIVDGNVSASGYFDLEGNEITGGTVKEFFAGTSAGVSESSPVSQDIFIEFQSGEVDASDILIHTTHSNTFSPNHYVFVKIEDEFITKQEGSNSNYNVGNLSAGVHRYLVYGAQTGSGGETHQIYTTLFIKGFFNEAPILSLPTSPTLSIAHDETVGSLVLHFTNSYDENGSDAISYFTASKETEDPTTATDTTAAYDLVMNHSNFSGQSVSDASELSTSSFDTNTHNGLKPYTNTLFFTASISNYNIVDSGRVYWENRNDEVEFKITLKDENEITSEGLGFIGVTSESFKLHILAPPTASISNIRTEFEDGGFTGNSTTALTHTLLYDRISTIDSASMAELHQIDSARNDKYTSSLVRVSTRADIIDSINYTPPPDHTAFIRIQSSSDSNISIGDKTDKKLAFFQFKGGEQTASFFGDGPDQTQTTTESLGFTSFVFTPNFTNGNIQTLNIGANTVKDDLNNTTNIQYGNNNHYEAFTTSPNELILHKVPNIEISDIVVEVESGSYGPNTGHLNLTSSLLYGYTASLKSEEIQTLLTDKLTGGINHPQYNNYVSASIVRLRVKAKITEPFGPDHKPITFTLTGSNASETEHFAKEFSFSRSSGIANCIESSSIYSNEAKSRLVGIYTSSWVEFNFKEGVYNFTTHLASSSNAGSTIDTISTAVVSMSNYNDVSLNELVYETETQGYSGIATTNTTRQVLYGHSHKLFGNSSSYADHDNALVYARSSVSRMRVRGKIIEPFGPANSSIDFNFLSTHGGTSNFIINAFNIDTTSSNTFNSQNQLVTEFTSSFIENPIDFSSTAYNSIKGASVTTDWTLGGSPTLTPDSTNEFEGEAILATPSFPLTTLTITDTPATEFSFTPIETETFGESNIAIQNTDSNLASQISRSIRSGQSTTDVAGSGIDNALTGSSVSRFRTLVTITEPLGYLHYGSNIKMLFSNESNSSNNVDGPVQTFSTNSTDIFDSSSEYNGQDKLVTSYTSSFIGSALKPTPNQFYRALMYDLYVTHTPSGENGHNYTTDNNSSLNFVITGSDNTLKIEDIVLEVESASNGNITGYGSDIGHSELTSSLMYGFTSSLFSYQTQSLIEDRIGSSHPKLSKYNSSSIIRFRVKSKITEPFGSEPKTVSASFKATTAGIVEESVFIESKSIIDQELILRKDTGTVEQEGLVEKQFDFTGNSDFNVTRGDLRLVTMSIKGDLDSLPGEGFSNLIIGGNTIITDFDQALTADDEYEVVLPYNLATTLDEPVTFPNPNQTESISINDGKINVSVILDEDPDGTGDSEGILHTKPLTIKCTFEYDVYEIAYISSPEDLLFSPTFSFGLNQNQPGDNNVMSSVISSSENVILNDQLKVVNRFTSSWVEFKIPTGSYKFLHSGFTEDTSMTLDYIFGHTSTASVSMSDVPATQLEDLFYEGEHSGLTGSGVNDANIVTTTERTVLYGHGHQIFNNSSSYHDHPSSSTYASHSVARFRTRGKITEPFGPASSQFTIAFKGNNTSNGSDQDGSNYTTVDTTTSTTYDSNDRLITIFTSSLGNEAATFPVNAGSTAIYIISGSASKAANHSYEENTLNISTPTFTTLTVKDTPATEITDIVYETETFGESNVGMVNDDTNKNVTRSIFNGSTTLTTGSDTNDLYTASVVSRFRIRAKITEPLGPLHHESTFDHLMSNPDSARENINGPIQTFSTSSSDIFEISKSYDSQTRSVTEYTSSFIGIALESTVYDNNNYSYTGSAVITHSPTGEQSHTETTPSNLIVFVSESFSNVAVPTVTNLRVEVESAGSASNTFGNERFTNVLHGMTGSETNQNANEDYDALSKIQLVMARVIATIEEPFPSSIHNALEIEVGGYSGTKILSFATNSTDLHESPTISNPTTNQGLTGIYTSSYFPILLNATGNTTTPSTNNADELTYIVSASVGALSIQTSVAPINTPLASLSHSVVHVTGALSSSTAITIHTASGADGEILSSSVFGSGEAESLYFVFPTDYSNADGYQADFNNSFSTPTIANVKLFPSLVTTPPEFTSESNINFAPDNHLDIQYTSSTKYIDFNTGEVLNSNPSNGTASIAITRPSYEAGSDNNANTIRKATITTTVTDTLVGNGIDLVTTDIFVIPAPAVSMLGDLTIHEIGAHPAGTMKDKLYLGLLSSESFDNYSGSNSANYPTNPGTEVSSDRILFASTSAGYNYSMSLFTHTNNTANYNNGTNSGFISDNLAYNFGDSGSLELKINGDTKTIIDLEENFILAHKGGNQQLTNYDIDYLSYPFNNGTASFDKGRLIITKIAPFNNVSQSLFAHGHDFPNGFQAFNASIELDNKFQDGYNTLELIHNISPGHTQSLNTFDWYYNDGIETGSLIANETMSYEETPSIFATHSLSGVSYFRHNTIFTSSIGNIINLANKVYPHDDNGNENIAKSVFSSGIVGQADGTSITSNNLQHKPSSGVLGDGVDSRKGMRFNENDANFIPTSVSIASLKFEVSTNVPSNVNPIKGKIHTLTFNQNIRNKNSDEHTYNDFELFTTSIGRFMKSGSQLSSLSPSVGYFAYNTLTASFFDEDRRWLSASMEESQSLSLTNLGASDFTFWTSDINANYDSIQNIATTNDLQQLYTGELIYPSESYNETSLPNIVDYSGISRDQQKYYYGAIYTGDAYSSNFRMIVKGNISHDDFPQSNNSSINANDGNVNIFVRIPGPVSTANAFNDSDVPGTEFGSVTGTTGTQTNIKQPNTNYGNANVAIDQASSPAGTVIFDFSFGYSSPFFAQGILLFRVAMSGSIHPTGSIKQITIEPR